MPLSAVRHWAAGILAGLLVPLLGCGATACADDFLEDQAAPLEEKQPRTEVEQNRLEALSLFGAARIEEQKDHLSEALRLYERALRYEPNALPIVKEIVPLAFSLERPNEAVRYALKAAELDPSDPLLLRQLGMHLAEAGRFQQALKLYQQARAHLEKAPRTAAHVMLLLELGRLCFVTDHMGEAADAFAQLLPVFQAPETFGLTEGQRKMFTGVDGARLLELSAEAFLSAGRPDEAWSAYEKLDELRPNKILHAFHLARVKAEQKKPAEALVALQAYLDANNTEAGSAPYRLLVKLLADTGEAEQIVPRLDAIAAADPKNTAVRHILAAAALDAGQHDRAEAVYRELLKASPSEDVYLGLVRLYRKTARWADLIKILGDTAIDREALDLLDEQAKELAEDKRAYGPLLEAGNAEFELDPDRLDYGDRLALAVVALAAEQFEAAEKFFSLALKVKREDAAGLYEIWGVGLILAEQYAAAARVFQQGIDEHVLPAGNTAFHHYLAGALEMSGKTDDALAVARAALAMPDPPPRMYSREAWVLYHAKRTAAAEQAYRAFLAKYDADHDSEELRGLLRDARLMLSNICANRDDMPQAEELLEQVLDEYPENIGAMNDLAYLWVEQKKNLVRAVQMIEQALETEPNNEAYRDSLGWAYYQMGRYPEAVAELKKAVAAGGDDPDGVILQHLGDALEKAGSPEAARDARQQGLAAFEREGDVEKAAILRQKLK